MQPLKPPIADDAATAIAAEFKEYAYSVSHDLSAPVRAMVEFSKMLTSEHAEYLNDEGKEYLALIIDNGQKLQLMMQGLLQYSRLHTIAHMHSECSIEDIIKTIRRTMEPRISETATILTAGHMPSLIADREQITRVFKALINNAITYQPPGNIPTISISAEEKNGFWQFAVADNGIGIAPQFQEKIFKLFQRLHTDDDYEGIGIGLTLVQKIIWRHGGKIWYESDIGNGTIFYFTLPSNALLTASAPTV